MHEEQMPGRKHSPQEIRDKLRQVQELTGQGKSLGKAIETIGVGDATYYRWRNVADSSSIGQAQKLKQLELENTRLRQAVLQLTMDKMALQESAAPAGTPLTSWKAKLPRRKRYSRRTLQPDHAARPK
jgi:hypothetical protein